MADSRVRQVCEPLYYGPDHHFPPGVLSAEAGRASYDTIVRAVRDAQAGGIEGIATAPINKEALALAGLPWRGHTEMLASLTNAPQVAMMFWSEKLRVVLLTIHIPLASVPAALTVESVCAIIELTSRELPRFG
ncbi:MAG TPA: 4-hydroxythreonine-4-phosphate dehydrogenase PdxA, partial [Vicinamibacterales bacterium]|nr:4-hydroxythreonine-4-phosphate dehydrogenase PdxA [Vicinamibacterales bacterium]